MAEKKPKKLKIKILSDNSTSMDGFGGKSHTRTATALTKIISEQAHVSSIGLEGDWGSGKSSVVDIAEEQLAVISKDSKDEKSYPFFIFDTWAYQGDPLRRVFLEELITFLCDRNLLDKKIWIDVKLEKLKSRTKKTTTTTIPIFTRFGFVMLILTPVLPLAYLWLDNLESSTTSLTSIQWLAIVGIVIPYITVLTSRFWVSEEDRKSGKHRAFLFYPEKENVTEQYIRDEEPTIVEFSDIFTEIIKDLDQKKTKLCIVLDNLDRLPNDQIREAWAGMRSFFIHASNGEVSSKVSLVVPYDKKHILRVFSDHKTISDDISKTFIEKTFQVSLKVSPPLESHWQPFLFGNIEEALPKLISEDQKYNIYRLIELVQLKQPFDITPRYIKSLVNGLAAQYIQWNDEIPPEYHIIYLLYKDKLENGNGKNGLDHLRNETLVDPSSQNLLPSEDWSKFIAALHFNVEVEMAYEILLAKPIEIALKQNETTKLSELEKNNGFINILPKVIDTNVNTWASEDIVSLTNAAMALDSLTSLPNHLCKPCWAALANSATSIGAWIQIDEGITKGLIAIINGLSNSKAKKFFAALAKSLQDISGELKSDPEFASEWIKLHNDLKEALDKKEGLLVSTSLKSLHIPKNENFIYGVLSKYKNCSSLEKTSIIINSQEEELTTLLIENIKVGPNISDQYVIEYIINKPNLVDINSIIEALGDRLRGTSGSPNQYYTKYALQLFLKLQKSKDANEAASTQINSLCNDSHMLGVLALGINEKAINVQSYAIWFLINHFTPENMPNWGSHPVYGDLNSAFNYFNTLCTNPDNTEVMEECVKICLSQNKFIGIFSKALRMQPQDAIYKSIINLLVENNASLGSIKLVQILDNFDNLSIIINPNNYGKFMNMLVGYEEHFNKHIKSNPQRITTKALQDSKILSPSLFAIFKKEATQELKTLEKDYWLEEVVEEGPHLRLLFDLLELDEITLAMGKFQAPLLSYTKDIINEEATIPDEIERWHLLPQALNDSAKENFIETVFNALTNTGLTFEMVSTIVDMYGDKILDEKLLKKHPNNSIKGIFVPYLTENNEETSQWLESHVKILKFCYNKAEDKQKVYLEKSLEEAIEQEVETDFYSTLAKKIGVKIKPIKPDNDATTNIE